MAHMSVTLSVTWLRSHLVLWR